MQHCNKYQNNPNLGLPSGSNILPIYWSCRASAIYDLPINLRYIHKRVPSLVHMVLKPTPKWANFQIKFAQLQNLCITPREFCFWNHNLKVAAEGTAVENFELFRDCIFQIYLSTMIAYLRRRQRRMQFVDPFIHDHKREEVWQIQIRIEIIKIMFMYGGESTQTVNHFTADYLLFKFFQ